MVKHEETQKKFQNPKRKNNQSFFIIGILLLILLFAFSVFQQFPNFFSGTTKSQYHYVLKKFSQENELVVSEANIKTTRKQTFTSDEVKNWPDWSKPITDFFVSRKLTVEIPIVTEYKLDLKGLSENDVRIRNHVLTFKRPIKVLVDSQQEGMIKAHNENGLIDKAVDAATAGTKAQEFLEEKSMETIRKTSDYAMKSQERREKVRKFAEADLKQLLNLKDGDNISVRIRMSDLEFVNMYK